MSRISDTERGARIALEHATALLAAGKGSDLFPIRLTRNQRRLWVDIRDSALAELEEQVGCRAAVAEARV